MKKSWIVLMAGIGLLTACQESSTVTGNRFTVSLHANYIHPDQTEFQVGSAGGSARFTVTSQETPWAILSVPDWISVAPTSGSATADVSVTVPEYPWASPRVGIFSLESSSSDWSYSRPITVTQSGTEPYLVLDKRDFSFDGEAHSESVPVSFNFDWSLTKKGNDWISISATGGEMVLSVPANESGSDRTGEVDITFNGMVMATVHVTQLAAKVSLKTDPLNFENVAGSYKLTIESEAPWQVDSYYDWISVSPSSGVAGKTEVTVSVPPNPDDYGRDGFLYFRFRTTSHMIAEIPVHQDGIVLELTDGDDFLQNLTSLGGDIVFHLRSNTDWVIDQVPDFMTISPMSGSGSTTLSVKLLENATFDGRSGYLALLRQSTGYIQNYLLIQRARTHELSSTWIECNDLAQDLYVDVKTEGGWLLQSEYPNGEEFFTPSPMQSRGDGRITFSVAANSSYDGRQGFTNFFLTGMDGYDGGLAQVSTIYINQSGWQDKYQQIKQAVQLPSDGGTMSVDIATNDGWTAEFVSAASWIRVDGPADGKGAGSLTLAFDENKTVDARSVKIRVSFEHLDPVEFTVTQLGKAIRLSSDALYFFAKGGTITVIVDADGAYSVARASGDWFTVTPGSNNTFTVKADAYSGDVERTGSIVLALTDLQSGSYTLTLPVMQTTASGFTRTGWQEDRNLNIGTAPGFSFQVTGYEADQNWSGGRYVTVGGEGYGPDENWN